MILKIVMSLIWLVGIIIICYTYYNIPKPTYRNQIGMPTVCDEYLFYKKADVPIACYEYFGIK